MLVKAKARHTLPGNQSILKIMESTGTIMMTGPLSSSPPTTTDTYRAQAMCQVAVKASSEHISLAPGQQHEGGTFSILLYRSGNRGTAELGHLSKVTELLGQR